jgi:glycerophosphoryl diester phosphodiesterase
MIIREWLKSVLFASSWVLLAQGTCVGAEKDVIVIAHRGASGYIAEHTAPAKALAHGMGADFIEQDCVLTADDHPVVLHDIHLDTVTDVAQRFPTRKRADGRYYAIDFTLSEIKQLRVHERIHIQSGAPVYPKRFPLLDTELRVLTLGEEIRLIQGLNKSTGRIAGMYPEIKSPTWHRQQGRDLSRIVLETLTQHGYQDRQDPVYVQCFEAAETERLRTEFQTKLKLIQLIGDDDGDESATDYQAMCSPAGLRHVAEYADGIGPSLNRIVTGKKADGSLVISDLVRDAHAVGLQVHPYTFRADDLPDYADSFDELLAVFVEQAGVDGVFTDFPDLAIRYRDR